MPIRICQQCGKEYEGNSYKFCSSECYAITAAATRRAKNPPKTTVPTICCDCQKPIEKPDYRRIRCSACQTKKNHQVMLANREKQKLKRNELYVSKKSVLGSKSKMSDIVKINTLARELHMSYGEYMAQIHK